jgi:hypothetical protein
MQTLRLIIALVIMITGTYLASTDEPNHRHSHLIITHEESTHSHKHTQEIHHSHAH